MVIVRRGAPDCIRDTKVISIEEIGKKDVLRREKREEMKPLYDQYMALRDISPCRKMVALKDRGHLFVVYMDGESVPNTNSTMQTPATPPLVFPTLKWRTVLDEVLPSDIAVACFSPCSRYLAVLCSANSTLRVWGIHARSRELKVGGEKGGKEVKWSIHFPSSSRPSHLLSSLPSVTAVPFFTPLLAISLADVHGTNQQATEEDWGDTCCFSPSGDTLCVITRLQLRTWRVMREEGGTGSRRMQRVNRQVSHFYPCCHDIAESVDDNLFLGSLPSFRSDRLMILHYLPDFFFHFSVGGEIKGGESKIATYSACKKIMKKKEHLRRGAKLLPQSIAILFRLAFPPPRQYRRVAFI
mmetsp:Transcript_23539/g.59404  ORF Transcript_23539/g.59404 Transcript_23539/m.59404 type:complete len:355 (-) Transcript_23539:625-1689(-)